MAVCWTSLANAAQVVNVDYIAKYVMKKWNVDVPYDSTQGKWVANMEYLLNVVDYVNEQLNGAQTSNYADDERFATKQAADTVAANYAVEKLINKLEYPFEFVPAVSDKTFSFSISAAGTFYIDWGDGSDVQKIVRDDVTPQDYSHTYDTAASNYTIGLDGLATGYSNEELVSVISFAGVKGEENHGLKRIAGCLGCIFPTIGDGSGPGQQPRFVRVFQFNYSLTGSMTKELFKGVHGQPVSSMFRGLCESCGNLITEIPEDLFAGISGTPTNDMFRGAFRGWAGKKIPAGLFRTVKGKPAQYMFAAVFADCPNIEELPKGLFDNISGAPVEGVFDQAFMNDVNLKKIPKGLFSGMSGAATRRLFRQAFLNCPKLESIPEDLFGNITSLGESTFEGMFDGCSSLKGESAKINNKYLYEIWTGATSAQVDKTYNGATGLQDYYCIPTLWGGLGTMSSCTLDMDTDTFTFVPATSDATYSFNVSAAGKFGVDWGDGTSQVFGQSSAKEMTISHTYSDGKAANAHTIGIGGTPTKYATGTADSEAAISFRDDVAKVKSIGGCLGCVFPTLSGDNQPVFFSTFLNNTDLKGPLPTNLFSGIEGQPVANMFRRTFEGCSSLQTSVPARFFGITGTPTSYLFSGTFNKAPITSIDADVFDGVSGTVEEYMFNSTFANTAKLTEIPAELFDNFSGNAERAFQRTFMNDTGLTEVPDGLFDSLDYSDEMFFETFNGCTNLTSTPF